MALHLRLVDRARVVVQAAGDPQIRDERARHAGARGIQQRAQLAQALLQEGPRQAQLRHPGADLGGRSAADARHLQQRARLRGSDATGGELPGDALRADLVEFVQAPQRGVHVADPQALTRALDDLAVVHEDPHGRDRQGVEGLRHDQGQVDLEVERELPVAHHVDVGLREFAEAPLLRALTAPHLLDLVALEGEVQLVGVLDDVARERDREVEVEAHAALLAGAAAPLLGLEGLQAVEDVDLLRGLALGLQLLQGLDGARLDPAEPVQLEDAAQGVEHVLLDDAPVGQPLGKSGQGCAGHGGIHFLSRRLSRCGGRGSGTRSPRSPRPWWWPARDRGSGRSRGRSRWTRCAGCGASASRPRRAGRCARRCRGR